MMKRSSDHRNSPQSLRARAEALLRAKSADTPTMPTEDVQALIQELNVHQMELEIQNEDLRQALVELAHARDRYADLYDFAPIGYLTLDKDGNILEANLTAATMLGVERQSLVRTKISTFVARDCQDECYLYWQTVLSSEATQTCEIEMHKADGTPLVVRLESIAFESEQERRCRTALVDVTERKAAEKALQRLNEELEQRIDARTADLRSQTQQLAQKSTELERREREFRALADNVPALFSYVDCRERYRYVNRRYTELFERPFREIVGKTVAQLLGPARYDVARPHVEAVLRGEAVTYEAEFNFADGPHAMHVHYVPDFDEETNVKGFFTLVSDVTVLKRAEKQATLLAEAVANLGEGVVITDDELEWPGPRIQFVNQAMCRITGYSADELIGQTPRMLQGEGTDRKALNRLKADLSAGRPCLLELTNYRKDGTAYDAELFITPLVGAEGRCTNFVSIHRDISKRKQTERALRESEERMRAVLNAAADSIITIDRRGIIDNVNPASEQMFGFTRDELIGQNVKILMPPPYHDEHDGYLARYLETREPRLIGIGREVIARRKDGSTFPADLSVSEVDHLGLFTGTIRDISDVKELQRQVLEIAAEEDRRIGHELHEGVQQELTAMALLAGTIREVIDAAERRQVEGNVARPLEGAELLRCREIADKLCKELAGTHAHVQQLSHGIMPVPIDAHGLNSALAELAATADAVQNIRCRFESPDVVEVADNTTATHLYRIAQEAVNNALRHSHGDEIRIRLAQQGGQLILEVGDNGVGIDPRFTSRGGIGVTTAGIGLRAMHYRAGLIGATLDIGRRKGSGTHVRCTVLKG